MHKAKSQRHVKATNTRWREAAAQAERDAGIPDREAHTDVREPITLDFRSYGGGLLRIEPRLGYTAVRVLDDATGAVLHCAALKESMHWIASQLPRLMAMRNCR